MLPAIFLDRDGVIIENCPSYVRRWEDVTFFPQALQALKWVSALPYKVILITNQSAVGRGLITLETARSINARLVEAVAAAGGRIDAVYLCPHDPLENCDCRKPKPGLILQAVRDHAIDLHSSHLIGDAWTDLIAGQAAGLSSVSLVRTGRGASQLLSLPPLHLHSFHLFADLAEALERLIPET